MFEIYQEDKINRLALLLSWSGVIMLAIVEYFVKFSWTDAANNIFFGMIYVFPTLCYFVKKFKSYFKHFLIWGTIIYIYIMIYVQKGIFDDIYYLFVAIAITAVYFDIRLTTMTTLFIIISSTILYIGFKPFFFPVFSIYNFMTMIGAIVLTGAILCIATYWGQKLVLSHVELYKKAFKDPLTQTHNRTFFIEIFEAIIEEHKTVKSILSIIVLDIDNFKKINDTLGHSAGDHVLQEVTNRMTSICRKQDIISRFGGDEFIVVLQNTNQDEATVVAEKIRKKIAEKDMGGILTTVSLGLTSLRSDDTELSIFDRADKALYAAKNKGKNCLEVL